MSQRIKILNRRIAFEQAIFKIEEVKFQQPTFQGDLSPILTRLNLDRGDSAAAVVHNTTRNTLLLTEQFRFPTYDKGPGWLLELPAGIVQQTETPEESMRRELEEEIGYHAGDMIIISQFYLSPGGSSEQIHLFYAPVKDSDRLSAGGGSVAEGEYIRVVEMPLDEAFHQMEGGEILDAKTIIGLQWLKMRTEVTAP